MSFFPFTDNSLLLISDFNSTQKLKMIKMDDVKALLSISKKNLTFMITRVIKEILKEKFAKQKQNITKLINEQ